MMVTRADISILMGLEFNIGDLITILATVVYAMKVNIEKCK